MKILVTGGPVHGKLDSVKLITNRFKGGLMADLALKLSHLGADVTYLYSPEAGAIAPDASIRRVIHAGFDDYEKIVKALSPSMDAVVLGAAVANLIPVKQFPGKFPSHNYKPGDIIPIDFMIAPRIVDMVKSVAPDVHLFAFKLLSNVAMDDLIAAAYGILLESKATAVIANDTSSILDKFIVTKERAVHAVSNDYLAEWIWDAINDEYYSTILQDMELEAGWEDETRALVEKWKEKFISVETGLIFGTVAKRHGNRFVTTGRGKHETESFSYVASVDDVSRVVTVAGQKASLNAPLLAKMFENPAVDHVVHYHEQVAGIPTYPYALPGTRRDTDRKNETSFNIADHGCILLFDKNGDML